jgi:hypothetical protein
MKHANFDPSHIKFSISNWQQILGIAKGRIGTGKVHGEVSCC